jgi:hypothetical protein
MKDVVKNLPFRLCAAKRKMDVVLKEKWSMGK